MGCANVRQTESSDFSRWMSSSFQPSLATVIIPAYNRATFIKAAMTSVLTQDYRPLEMIVVDDGSKDDTPAVACVWIRRHEDGEFLAVLVRQPKVGPAAAGNLGFWKSHGEFIQFLDSDHYYSPGRFSYTKIIPSL